MSESNTQLESKSSSATAPALDPMFNLPEGCPGRCFFGAPDAGELAWLVAYKADANFSFVAYTEPDGFGNLTMLGSKRALRAEHAAKMLSGALDKWETAVEWLDLEPGDEWAGPWSFNVALYLGNYQDYLRYGLGVSA